MSYETRIDEMVGKHVAGFQLELSLARQMNACARRSTTPDMPYGYPVAVYRPLHVCRVPEVKQFIRRTGGRLSNGVPRVLRMEFVGENILGIYNPLRYACGKQPPQHAGREAA